MRPLIGKMPRLGSCFIELQPRIIRRFAATGSNRICPVKKQLAVCSQHDDLNEVDPADHSIAIRVHHLNHGCDFFVRDALESMGAQSIGSCTEIFAIDCPAIASVDPVERIVNLRLNGLI
mmetsp:Transcript_63922/g.171248  ORF Transcript_63922/g.171248 Transcript_63922/m.171248 type:complete len:120 (-) Transcript_63922:511-870(-)